MDQEGETEIRESTNENNDERYTQVENDVLSNPIEGYQENKEEEKEVKNEEEENMEIEEFNEEYEVPEENPNINNIGEDIVNKHMVIIKEAANILSQEGDLITNIKGVGKEQNFTLDNYIDGLELIVDKKLDMYGDIKNRIKKYRKSGI